MLYSGKKGDFRSSGLDRCGSDATKFLISARMPTIDFAETSELLAKTRIQTEVSFNSFCTIRILWMKSARLSAPRASA
jgi:hypothetical protein